MTIFFKPASYCSIVYPIAIVEGKRSKPFLDAIGVGIEGGDLHLLLTQRRGRISWCGPSQGRGGAPLGHRLAGSGR